VLVRPEQVHRGIDGIAMRVVSSIFEGERFAVTLSLPDGQQLKAYSSVALGEGALVPFVVSAGWRL
jgi:hypothetical protein